MLENNKSCEYIKKRFKICKIKQKKRKILSIVLIIFLIIFSFVTYLIRIVNPLIFYYSEAEIEKMITQTSNYAIESVILNISYDEIIDIKYDKDGNISSIETKHTKINEISNKLANFAQKEINSISKLGIKIPIGTCSGISFLVGKGHELNFSINPIGDVVCEFTSCFESAGINQTLHKIYVDIKTEVSLILPFNFKSISKNAQFLVSECIIVGKIPNVYLAGIS